MSSKMLIFDHLKIFFFWGRKPFFDLSLGQSTAFLRLEGACGAHRISAKHALDTAKRSNLDQYKSYIDHIYRQKIFDFFEFFHFFSRSATWPVWGPNLAGFMVIAVVPVWDAKEALVVAKRARYDLYNSYIDYSFSFWKIDFFRFFQIFSKKFRNRQKMGKKKLKNLKLSKKSARWPFLTRRHDLKRQKTHWEQFCWFLPGFDACCGVNLDETHFGWPVLTPARGPPKPGPRNKNVLPVWVYISGSCRTLWGSGAWICLERWYPHALRQLRVETDELIDIHIERKVGKMGVFALLPPFYPNPPATPPPPPRTHPRAVWCRSNEPNLMKIYLWPIWGSIFSLPVVLCDLALRVCADRYIGWCATD